jgi:hypothetical protein
MSTILRPSLQAQAATDRWQVEIVDLTATYRRNAGMKSAAILDGAEFCRVEEFAARHFRRSGFEATFVESAPFHVLFGVFFWSVIQDRCDRQVRTVGIMAPWPRSGGTQRVDMDTTAVRLREFRLLTPSGQGPHQASLSHRRNEGRAASPV